jgi:acyl carrier protein
MRPVLLILLVLSAGAFLFALIAPRLFPIPWYAQIALVLVAIAISIYQVRLSDASEKQRALDYMAGRQPLADTQFGREFFPPEQADVASKLRRIMSRHIPVDLSRLHPDDRIVEDIRMDALDSMSTVEFILDVEKEFGISIPDAAAEKMRTLRDAIDYVSQAKQGLAA